MKWIAVLVCLALIGGMGATELTAAESTVPRTQSPASGIVDRILNVFIQVFLYINNLCYRLTGGLCGIEAYCF